MSPDRRLWPPYADTRPRQIINFCQTITKLDLFTVRGAGYAHLMTDLTRLYADLVAAGSLTADPAQEAVLPQFERIRAGVAEPVKSGWFRKAAEPPKGLYLWGGVAWQIHVDGYVC